MRKLTRLAISLVLGLSMMVHSTYAEDNKDARKEKTECAEVTELKSEKLSPVIEALSSAYITNSALRAKLHSQYANDETVSQAFSRFMPQLVITGNTGVQHVETIEPAADLTQGLIPTLPGAVARQHYASRPTQAQIQLTQPIYNGGGD